MPTRNLVLTDHHDKMIQALVESGRYRNASEVMREGLRMVETRDAENAARIAAIREAVQVGIDAIDRDNYREFANFDELNAYLTVVTEDVVSGNLALASQQD